MNRTLHVIKEIEGELMDVVHDIYVIITQRQGNFIVTCITLVGPVFTVLKNIVGQVCDKVTKLVFKVYDNNIYGNIK